MARAPNERAEVWVPASGAVETQRCAGRSAITLTAATTGTTRAPDSPDIRSASPTNDCADARGPRSATDTTGATTTTGAAISAVWMFQSAGQTVDTGTTGATDTARATTTSITANTRVEAAGTSVTAITPGATGATVTAGITGADPVGAGRTINTPAAHTAIAAIS